MHPLDGAHERVTRSSEHLSDLQSMVGEFLRSPIIATATVFNSQSQQPIVDILAHPFAKEKFGPIPLRISILVGEVIYNLRCSLDYLVYELACLDSKQIVEGTQFPIEDSGEAFVSRIGLISDRRRKGVYLRGVSDTHVALISALQPCYGCHWTLVLRELSNPDKHRHLTIVNSPFFIASSPTDQTEAIIPSQPMQMNYKVTRQIAFDDGTFVIETLEQLQSHVSETIDALDSEFK